MIINSYLISLTERVMPALDDILQQKLAALDEQSARRRLVETEPMPGMRVQRNGKELLSFCGNDYLGMSGHPDVVAAGVDAAEHYGAGAGASRLVTGNYSLYAVLEARLAQLKGTEAACVFGSGYHVNSGMIPALVGRDDLIVADRLIHASLIDGAKLSGAKLVRFRHNDAAHAAELLSQYRGLHRHCLLLTESVFSMDGDVAPLEELSSLAVEHDGWLAVDDAHGLGVVELSDVHVDIWLGTLSKAVGVYGGYICASQAVVDWVQTAVRSLVFSTALPPFVVAAADKALQLMQGDEGLRAKPLQRARQFTDVLGLPPAQSPIVPLVIGENQAALEAASSLVEAGYLVGAIRPPTVPDGTARLRFTFSALHSEADVTELAEVICSQSWWGAICRAA